MNWLMPIVEPLESKTYEPEMKILSTSKLFFPSLLIATLITCPCCRLAQGKDDPAKVDSKSHPKIYQGNVTQNELVDNLERLGIKCTWHDGAVKTLVVSTVRMGSNAFYKGVAEGDTVKSLVNKNGLYELTIDRGGKIYQLTVRPLSAEVAQTSPMQATASKTALQGNAQEKVASIDTSSHDIPIVDIGPKKVDDTEIQNQPQEQDKKLVKYDIDVILDITGSMNDADGTGGESKFAWCHDQVRMLAQKLAPYGKTFAITTFNDSYNTQENCNPSKVEELYASIKPSGRTDLLDPLMSRCQACLARQRQSGRPQLIVIISDGMPNIPRDPKTVNRALVDFSQRLSARSDVTITFLQIGDNFQGRDFCLDLDENLVNEGAKFDLVHTTTFGELKRDGIVDVLVDAVRSNLSNSSPADRHLNRFVKSLPRSDVAEKSDAIVKQKRAERKALEKQLLEN